MKQTLKVLAALMITLMASAPRSYASRGEGERVNRKELADAQARHISNELAFDDGTAKKFMETYCRCQQEIWGLGPRIKASSDTDEAAENEIESRFEHRQKLLDIRRKYYKEYRKFLTPKQIKRVYRIERQMMDRLSKRKKTLPRRR